MTNRDLIGKHAYLSDSNTPNIILGTGYEKRSNKLAYITADIDIDDIIRGEVFSWIDVKALDQDVIVGALIIEEDTFNLLYDKHPLSNMGWSYSKDYTLFSIKEEALFNLPYNYE